ncbi:MAG: TetR/AcrR family transcriptional regulator [Burkholderiaceae bacterium]|nr:TetR/AcrR family transcriptional regulator [Burkholderiaceae bacterium]
MIKKKPPIRTSSPTSSVLIVSPRKDLIRESLLDKAAELFVLRGYANTRMQDIAEEMGLAKSSLYHYFQSKDKLLQALTEDLAAQGVERLEVLRANRNLTPIERLQQATLGSILSKLQGGMRFRMADRIEAELPDEIRTAFKNGRRRVLELTIEMIESGIKSGHFRPVDAKITAFSILGMANWTAWWYTAEGDRSPEQIAESMTTLILRGLINEDGPSKEATNIASTFDKLKHQVNVLESLVRTLTP